MPTSSSIASAALAAAPRPCRRCVTSASMICAPTVISGLSEAVGSWKIIDMTSPRIAARPASSSGAMSRPSSTIAPERRRATGGSSPMMARAVRLLPQPLSPTSATVSPARIVKFMPVDHRRVADRDREVAHAEQVAHAASSAAAAGHGVVTCTMPMLRRRALVLHGVRHRELHRIDGVLHARDRETAARWRQPDPPACGHCTRRCASRHRAAARGTPPRARDRSRAGTR